MRHAPALIALLICLGAAGCVSVWANLLDRDDRNERHSRTFEDPRVNR